MRTDNINIKGNALNLVIFEALQDDSIHPAMVEFTSINTPQLVEVIRAKFIDFKTSYPSKESKQWLVLEQWQDRGQGEQLITSKQYQFDIRADELVTVNLGQGEQQIPRFKLFRYLSEIGALRLPENYINGLLNFLTEKQELFPSFPNPLYIDRTNARTWPRAEAYKQDYSLAQPYIVELMQISPETESLGEVQFTSFEWSGQQEYKLNNGEWTVFADSLLLPLGSGNHKVELRDANSTYTFDFTVDKE